MSPRQIDPLTHYAVEDRGYDTPCWIWQGAKSKEGYGRVHLNGQSCGAHRLFYEHHKEELIDPPTKPGTMGTRIEVDHKCFQPDCVNPGHLRAMEQKAHLQMHRSGGFQRKRKSFFFKGSTFSRLEKLAKAAGLTQRDYIELLIERQSLE